MCPEIPHEPLNAPRIRAGQVSLAGARECNADACTIHIPRHRSELFYKGIVAAIADGIGASEAGREAAEHCVLGFIADYYGTPDSWSVKTSGHRVIRALNAWLYSQAQRRGAGMAATLSVLVLKSTSAHIFHIGDSRIWLLRRGELRQLTQDHRMITDGRQSCITRAMGADYEVHVDYDHIMLEAGDRLILTTDGVHDWLNAETLAATAGGDDPQQAARAVVARALEAGSDDNLTCQIVEVLELPDMNKEEFFRRLTELPFPPPLHAGMDFDGYRILRELHASPTVQVYLAKEIGGGEPVVLKTPSPNFEDDPAYIDRFVKEEWVGRRITHPNVLKVLRPRRQRRFLYYVTEYIDGQSLAQWMLDHRQPELSEVRDIAHQVIAGLRAFHRREMVHGDIKPENIMIDRYRRVKIIDFGATFVAGLEEISTPLESMGIAGTANYIAPELLDGFLPSPKSDMYSLGVMLYEMLSGGRFPYGHADRARRHRHYDYTSVRYYNPDVPVWMDEAIRRAVHPDPDQRYDTFSEFEEDLNRPNPALMKAATPLLERDPVGFWRWLAIAFFVLDLVLLLLLSRVL